MSRRIHVLLRGCMAAWLLLPLVLAEGSPRAGAHPDLVLDACGPANAPAAAIDPQAPCGANRLTPVELRLATPAVPATGLSPRALETGTGDSSPRAALRHSACAATLRPPSVSSGHRDPACTQLLAGLRRNEPATYGNPPPIPNS